MLFDRLKLLLSFVKPHLLTVWSGYIGLVEVTHHKRYQCLDKPNCHVVPGAHDVSSLQAGVFFMICPKIDPKDEDLDVCIWDQDQIDVKEEQNDQSEWVPDRQLVHRSTHGLI